MTLGGYAFGVCLFNLVFSLFLLAFLCFRGGISHSTDGEFVIALYFLCVVSLTLYFAFYFRNLAYWR